MEYSLHYNELKFNDVLYDTKLIVTLLLSTDKSLNDKLFTEDNLTEIVNKLSDDNYTGFAIVCNDIMTFEIRHDVCSIIRTLKAVFGNARKIVMRIHNNNIVKEIIDLDDPDVKELVGYLDDIDTYWD